MNLLNRIVCMLAIIVMMLLTYSLYEIIESISNSPYVSAENKIMFFGFWAMIIVLILLHSMVNILDSKFKKFKEEKIKCQ